MQSRLSSQAEAVLNVRVVVGKPQPDGHLQIKTDRRFKNTATRFMTESICNYLSGAENTYKRGKGRPNYMGIGTMGITKQPKNAVDTAQVADNFSDTTYVKGETTRPWFESTSLALSTMCGPVNIDSEGNNLHFWDPAMGWGKNGFTGAASEEPIFQGELCTNLKHTSDEGTGVGRVYDDIERIPILRADVLSDCPMDWDYGNDGYCSQVIFYAYASVEWVHKLLHPTYKEIVVNPTTQEQSTITHEIGPQLEKMAISEFGLYEKNNTDPHGLETMLAGFRVPTPDDIVYVTDGEVILIEWRVSVRAIMPYEAVSAVTSEFPTGISIKAQLIDNRNVQMSAIVHGSPLVSQDVTWELTGNTSTDTTISNTGLLHISDNEQTEVLYIKAASRRYPEVFAKSVLIPGGESAHVKGISLTTLNKSSNSVQFVANVIVYGNLPKTVTWTLSGNTDPATTISNQGVLTIGELENSEAMQVKAVSVADTSVESAAVILRFDRLAGTYTISDLSIETVGGST